ncbi:MAG: DUF309 domain-containing protein [Chloroflexi bacterium]|nr:DUF309 domain-containing protein [Chloroflexota bacterium]
MDMPIQQTSEFIQGFELFNAGHYWHAHEAWEVQWLQRSGNERDLLQGLIQTAAALVHWSRGNPKGLLLNWHKAAPKLQAALAWVDFLDLQHVIVTMQALVDDQAKHPPQLRFVSASDPLCNQH